MLLRINLLIFIIGLLAQILLVQTSPHTHKIQEDETPLTWKIYPFSDVKIKSTPFHHHHSPSTPDPSKSLAFSLSETDLGGISAPTFNIEYPSEGVSKSFRFSIQIVKIEELSHTNTRVHLETLNKYSFPSDINKKNLPQIFEIILSNNAILELIVASPSVSPCDLQEKFPSPFKKDQYPSSLSVDFVLKNWTPRHAKNQLSLFLILDTSLSVFDVNYGTSDEKRFVELPAAPDINLLALFPQVAYRKNRTGNAANINYEYTVHKTSPLSIGLDLRVPFHTPGSDPFYIGMCLNSKLLILDDHSPSGSAVTFGFLIGICVMLALLLFVVYARRYYDNLRLESKKLTKA
eukprot:TRINITY_DN12376_c0_g1_i1.p1 TRINITY_DN12376_c0_g1~~TRINITY_DN12376_c0_g1_i1.p1  ORF type:complete len:348 (+),score=56.16 TRINITY_DN12376_c0_g1_i1:40-1083(+)